MVILIGIETFFQVKKMDFKNIQWLLRYTQHRVKKWQKPGFTKNALILKLRPLISSSKTRLYLILKQRCF